MMAIKSVAVIYNNKERPETTGVYVSRALSTLVDVEHILPGEWERFPKKSKDLYLQIDDGYDSVLPEHLRPSAFWAIDTHMNLERYLRVAPYYDLVFTAQRDGAEVLQRKGIAATWLPLACDPGLHRRHELAKMRDLCFIGNLVDGPRVDMVHFLKTRFPSMLVDRKYFAEMAQAYSESKIVFNRSIKNDINMRIFEAVACGSLLMTNALSENGLDELFRDGTHLATYTSSEELLDKLRYYLQHDEIRETIANMGMAHAHQAHTYGHRVVRILEAAEVIQGKKAISMQPQPPAEFTSDSIYYGYVRQEILDLIPLSAKRILDIGCGAGRLGEVLKQRQQATVIGVETVPAAAKQAQARLDDLFEEDIESLQLSDREPFDVVVCADVLEHLKNPLAVLRKIHHWLKPNGRVVISLPNVQHHTVVRGLLEGHWTYEPAGLLDETHLRFFTRREMEKMLFRAGFEIEHCGRTTGAEYEAWVREGRKGEIKLGRLFVGGMTSQHAEDFHVYQFLFTATPRQKKHYGTTSIIVVTHNGLNDTRECLASLMQLTDQPYELICVDNGSTDGTPDYLETFAHAKVIRNIENRGFPAAVNQGLSVATGQQILLLNNDTVLTTGWLDRLLAALYSEDKIGLVGPISNCSPVQQRIHDVPYEADLIGMDGFAWDTGREQTGIRKEVLTLSGFCLLLRREVYEQIGKLDERFGIGTLEDDDYCLRALEQGWKLVVANDVFIHHTGHRTFHQLELDYDKLAEQNQRQFLDKWSLAPKSSDAEDAGNKWGLTSIVIPTHGQLQHTQRCIVSIRQHTSVPHEIIVVDNASPDESRQWLQAQHDLTVIANPTNRGFPTAVNQGLRMAQGQQLLVLNNDTVVTPNWLERLLEALYSASEVGMVGPCTNRISGDQQIEVEYDQETLQGLESFAGTWGRAHHKEYFSTDRLVGFCLLLKRSTYEKVGAFDEQFGIGNFEDDDYCLRTLQVGFKLLVARDAFLHHVGHATFRGAGVDFSTLMAKNQALFRGKWQSASNLSVSQMPMEYELADTGQSSNVLLQRKTIRLSLCIIVRNNAKFIVECLASIRPYVDEMIVVDTGSTDKTAELAQSLGARVYHFPWCDSFSAARNESLKHARGEWIFWMDSDDIISPECGRDLRALVYQEHPENRMGFIVQVHCIGAGSDGHRQVTKVDHVKLIRNHPQIRFEFRMHEQVMGAIRRVGGEIAWTDLYVTHANYDHTPEGQKHKLERDLKLLELDNQENPNHTFVLFNLGMTCEEHEPEKAIGYLEHCLNAATPGESHLRKAYAYLASAYARTQAFEQALKAAERGLVDFPLDTELRFRRANILLELGKQHESVEAWKDLLERHEERHITSVMQGLDSYMARAQLASTLIAMDRPDEAEREWKKVTDEAPWLRIGWRGWVDTLLRLKRYQSAADLVQSNKDIQELKGEREFLIALISLEVGDHSQVGGWFSQSLEYLPDDEVVLERAARYHFEQGSPQEAQRLLQKLVEVNPKDAAAHHNLGSLYLEAMDFAQAAELFKKSLEVRPKNKSTWELLSLALRKLGDEIGAKEAASRSLA
jgi:GT2 family glycosyltransferase/2-polyprenyl-3-methyl-5-hydroxy-6-metoxy-1,4-benzoquinol methylase/tetratricopeptide (TPR) repeat protein